MLIARYSYGYKSTFTLPKSTRDESSGILIYFWNTHQYATDAFGICYQPLLVIDKGVNIHYTDTRIVCPTHMIRCISKSNFD